MVEHDFIQGSLLQRATTEHRLNDDEVSLGRWEYKHPRQREQKAKAPSQDKSLLCLLTTGMPGWLEGVSPGTRVRDEDRGV